MDQRPSSAGLPDLHAIDFLSVMNRLDDGVIIADITGTILFYNQAQSRIDGIAPEQAMGQKVTRVYELNNRTSMIMQCIFRHAAIRNQAFFYRTISGKVANTITSVYPLFDDTGAINGVICFVRDYERVRRFAPVNPGTGCDAGFGNGTCFTFADLKGEGREFVGLRDAAMRAAASPSPVMIQGETGTGKELFAQSIHNHSGRRSQKYVAVNCAAIPHDLLEGLLFGTTRGAFTGAVDKPGLFETAHRGTLFLDELLAMPVALQARLLRAIQEKKIRRLGSAHEIPVDVKLISAVSRDPHAAIRDNALRKDLFYRLGVVMIRVPPLRQRRECLETLVTHFIEKCNQRLGTHVQDVSAEVRDLFQVYHWPGNVRELEHLIEGAMNMAGHEKILDVGQFTPGMDALEYMEADTWHPPGPSGIRRPEPDTLTDIQTTREKSAIHMALTQSRGNVTRAAGILGISRQLLHYKIRKYRLCRVDYMDRSPQLSGEKNF